MCHASLFTEYINPAPSLDSPVIKVSQIPWWWFPFWVQCQDQRLKQGRRHTQSNKPCKINLWCQIYCKGAHESLVYAHIDQDEAQRQLSCHPVSNTDRQRVEKRLDAVRHPFNWEHQDDGELRLCCVSGRNSCLWMREIQPAWVSAVTYQAMKGGSRTVSSKSAHKSNPWF